MEKVKRILILALISILLVCGVSLAAELNTTDLLFYAGLDEGAGTTFSNNGSATLTTSLINSGWASGKDGSSIDIPYYPSRVNIGGTDIDVDMNQSGFILSAWLYLHESTANQYAIVKPDSFRLSITPTGITGRGYGLSDSYATATGTVPLRNWTHVAYVYNGTHQIIIKNNETLLIDDTSGGTLVSNTNDITFGIYATDQHFNGKIDEVALYNSSENWEEKVSQLYSLDFKDVEDNHTVEYYLQPWCGMDTQNSSNLICSYMSLTRTNYSVSCTDGVTTSTNISSEITHYHGDIIMKGLDPDTEYTCNMTITDDNIHIAYKGGLTTKTKCDDCDNFTFMIVADSGADNDQGATVDDFLVLMNNTNSAYTVCVGDCWGTSDTTLTLSFLKNFSDTWGDYLSKMNYIGVIGNHENLGLNMAVLANKEYFHGGNNGQGESGTKVDNNIYSFEYGNTLNVITYYGDNVAGQLVSTQFDWVNSTLHNSTKKHKFVYSHDHFELDSDEIAPNLYNISAMINETNSTFVGGGINNICHDNTSQDSTNNGFCVGPIGDNAQSCTNCLGSFCESEQSYTTAQVQSNNIVNVSFYSIADALIYNFSIVQGYEPDPINSSYTSFSVSDVTLQQNQTLLITQVIDNGTEELDEVWFTLNDEIYNLTDAVNGTNQIYWVVDADVGVYQIIGHYSVSSGKVYNSTLKNVGITVSESTQIIDNFFDEAYYDYLFNLEIINGTMSIVNNKEFDVIAFLGDYQNDSDTTFFHDFSNGLNATYSLASTDVQEFYNVTITSDCLYGDCIKLYNETTNATGWAKYLLGNALPDGQTDFSIDFIYRLDNASENDRSCGLGEAVWSLYRKVSFNQGCGITALYDGGGNRVEPRENNLSINEWHYYKFVHTNQSGFLETFVFLDGQMIDYQFGQSAIGTDLGFGMTIGASSGIEPTNKPVVISLDNLRIKNVADLSSINGSTKDETYTIYTSMARSRSFNIGANKSLLINMNGTIKSNGTIARMLLQFSSDNSTWTNYFWDNPTWSLSQDNGYNSTADVLVPKFAEYGWNFSVAFTGLDQVTCSEVGGISAEKFLIVNSSGADIGAESDTSDENDLRDDFNALIACSPQLGTQRIIRPYFNAYNREGIKSIRQAGFTSQHISKFGTFHNSIMMGGVQCDASESCLNDSVDEAISENKYKIATLHDIAESDESDIDGVLAYANQTGVKVLSVQEAVEYYFLDGNQSTVSIDDTKEYMRYFVYMNSDGETDLSLNMINITVVSATTTTTTTTSSVTTTTSYASEGSSGDPTPLPDVPLIYVLETGISYSAGQTMMIQNRFVSNTVRALKIDCDVFIDKDLDSVYDASEPHDRLYTSIFPNENISFESIINIPENYSTGDYVVKGLCEIEGEDIDVLKSFQQFTVYRNVTAYVGLEGLPESPIDFSSLSDDKLMYMRIVSIIFIILILADGNINKKNQNKNLNWRK